MKENKREEIKEIKITLTKRELKKFLRKKQSQINIKCIFAINSIEDMVRKRISVNDIPLKFQKVVSGYLISEELEILTYIRKKKKIQALVTFRNFDLVENENEEINKS